MKESVIPNQENINKHKAEDADENSGCLVLAVKGFLLVSGIGRIEMYVFEV